MITIIDYDAGNLRSVANMLTFLDVPFEISSVAFRIALTCLSKKQYFTLIAMHVKIKLKIKTLEKVRGARERINSSVKGESCKNKIILQVNMNEIPTKMKK